MREREGEKFYKTVYILVCGNIHRVRLIKGTIMRHPFNRPTINITFLLFVSSTLPRLGEKLNDSHRLTRNNTGRKKGIRPREETCEQKMNGTSGITTGIPPVTGKYINYLICNREFYDS